MSKNSSGRDKRRLADKCVVCIGGGTGQATVLRGLRNYPIRLTAVVSVTDTGRSSGRLRRAFGMLPPGDIRNCLTSLSRAEPLMRELFDFRFMAGHGLKGMSFGNLLIAALTQITGSFDLAVKEAGRILAIQGRVLAATLDRTNICAELAGGKTVREELNVRRPGKPPIRRVFLENPHVRSTEEVTEAIRAADLIVLGPGALYTSVIANLLIADIRDAVVRSPARKVYVCSLVTQPGQTDGLSGLQHIREIVKYLGADVLDAVVLNTRKPPASVLRRYEKDGARLVRVDPAAVRRMGLRPIEAELVEDNPDVKALWEKMNLLRHDCDTLARVLVGLV